MDVSYPTNYDTKCLKQTNIIYRVRIVQRVKYELVESGYETSKSGYERSMGTKRLDNVHKYRGREGVERREGGRWSTGCSVTVIYLLFAA